MRSANFRRYAWPIISTLLFLSQACGGGSTTSKKDNKSPKQQAEEQGAKLLQDITPVKQLAIYLDGFHLMKDNPVHQMEAHHYCQQATQDFAQCVIYDSNAKNAHLIGVEYIISEATFDQLPAEEKKFWHPHNYEILSGMLVLPGLPDNVEKDLLKMKMNSYGKTWHTWNPNVASDQDVVDQLPLGDPMLMWSFNADQEAKAGLVEKRDQQLNVNTANKRAGRQDLVPSAKPQEGVDALAGQFPNRAPLNGVKDKNSGQTPAPAQ